MTTIVLLTPDSGDEPAAVLESRPGEAVLDTMRRLGWSHKYGCRRGGCGVCKVDLVSGETHDGALVASTVLTEDERAMGARLSCRAVPDTDVVVRVRTDDNLRCVNPWLAGAGARRS